MYLLHLKIMVVKFYITVNNFLIYYLYLFKHKTLVFLNMMCIIGRLFKRAIYHDNSKLKLSVAKLTIPIIRESLNIDYDSINYRCFLNKNKDALQLHYKTSDHHPEHYNNYKEMHLLALIEMVADWKAAIKKNKNGDINKSFKVAIERHGMSNEIITFLKTL